MLDDAAFGAATPITPKFISPADPAARWTGAYGGQDFFAYSANYLIDTDNAIIVDVQAITAIRQAEVTAARPTIERPQVPILAMTSAFRKRSMMSMKPD